MPQSFPAFLQAYEGAAWRPAGLYQCGIVNFSSTSGIKSVEGGAVYSASKFAVEGFTEFDGIQSGDPTKLAKALMHALQSDTPPLRLLCGRYAARSIDGYMQARRKEFDAWRSVTESCDFDE